MILKNQLFKLFIILSIIKFLPILLLECEIEQIAKEICAYDRLRIDRQVANCLVDHMNVKTKLFCEIDKSDESHDLCGEKGCIVAYFDLINLNDTGKSRKFDEINNIVFKWKIQKQNVDDEEKEIKLKINEQNILEYDYFFFRNATLTMDDDDTYKKFALLKIANVSYDLKYDICVNFLFDSKAKNEVSNLEKLCCHIIIEEPEHEIISFNLELIMIGFLVFFYILIGIISWKCPQTHDIHEVFKSLPKEKFEALGSLSSRRLQKSKVRLRNVSSATFSTLSDVSSDFTQEDETINKNRESEEIVNNNNNNNTENIEIVISDQTKAPTNGNFFSSNGVATITTSAIITRNDDDDDDVDDDEAARPSATSRRISNRRGTEFVFPNDSRLKKKNDKRRKSVQFNSNITERKLRGSVSTIDISKVAIDDDSDNDELTTKEKNLMKKDLNRRRQSMLIGLEFFANDFANKNKKENNSKDDVMDYYEEVVAKKHAEQARRASVYQFQKAFALDVSDSD